MKKLVLYLLVLSLFSACETGQRPDSNSTKKIVASSVKTEIENLTKEEDEDVDGLDDYEFEPDYIEGDEKIVDKEVESLAQERAPQHNEIVSEEEGQHFVGGIKSRDLDVQKIRVGRHDGFMRMVFDIAYADEEGRADEVGSYHIDYMPSHKDIEITIDGYADFSATLPKFSSKSIVKEIYQAQNTVKGRYKLILELKEDAKIRVFNLKKPAKLVLDIKPL
jgi:hypothetical protein